MKSIQKLITHLQAASVLFMAGCASQPAGVNDVVAAARRDLQRQLEQSLAPVRALASAQRHAANATFDLILNAAAQNFRHREGMALDSPLSDERDAIVDSIARKNLSEILAEVARTEDTLTRGVQGDFEHRCDLAERLARELDDEVAVRHLLESLKSLEDAPPIPEVDQVEDSFKNAVIRQTGYVGG